MASGTSILTMSSTQFKSVWHKFIILVAQLVKSIKIKWTRHVTLTSICITYVVE